MVSLSLAAKKFYFEEGFAFGEEIFNYNLISQLLHLVKPKRESDSVRNRCAAKNKFHKSPCVPFYNQERNFYSIFH